MPTYTDQSMRSLLLLGAAVLLVVAATVPPASAEWTPVNPHGDLMITSRVT